MSKGIGLHNGSNYCYYITTIQLLIAAPAVQAEIAKLGVQQEQLKNDISKDLYGLMQKYPDYRLLKRYGTFFNTYQPPVDDTPIMNKDLTKSSAESKEKGQSKKSLKEGSVSSKRGTKKSLTWFRYIMRLFDKLKQFIMYMVRGISSFINKYIVEPISFFIRDLSNDDEKNIDDKESIKNILSKIEAYYLIELFREASQDTLPEENLSFKEIWNVLKQIIGHQNRLNGHKSIAQDDVQLLSFIQKLGLQQIFGTSIVEATTINPLLAVNEEDASFFPEQNFIDSLPSLILSNFTADDLIELKEIVANFTLKESEHTFILEPALIEKINAATPELVRDKVVFNETEKDCLNAILREHQHLLNKLTPYKVRKTDLSTSIIVAPIPSDLSDPTKAILPISLFESRKDEIVHDYIPNGKEVPQSISRVLTTNYEVFEDTSVLNFKIKLGFNEEINSYEISPPLTVTAPVSGSDHQKTYYLHAIAMKDGTQSRGHWTSYRAVMNDEGGLVWHHFDDAIVTPVENFSVESRYPSELIYIEIPEKEDALRAAYDPSTGSLFTFRGKTEWFQKLKASYEKASLEKQEAEKDSEQQELEKQTRTQSTGSQTKNTIPWFDERTEKKSDDPSFLYNFLFNQSKPKKTRSVLFKSYEKKEKNDSSFASTFFGGWNEPNNPKPLGRYKKTKMI